MEPAPKRQRTADSDRVVLNVGGVQFHTTRTTLTAGSTYFLSRFSSEWVQQDSQEEDLFLDRDSDVFAVLLSCMRSRHVVLPEHDTTLATRVLLDAEFYGLDWLLQEVKQVAWAYLHPTGPAFNQPHEAVEAFDTEYGTLQEATRAGVLPARFFGPAGGEVVQQLIPSMENDRILFNGTGIVRAALGYALVRQVC